MFLPEGWRIYGSAKEAWQVWTFVDFGQKRLWSRRSRPRGGRGVVDATDCGGVGFVAMRAGDFLRVEADVGHRTVASAYFRGCGACTQYDPKIILGATNPRP